MQSIYIGQASHLTVSRCEIVQRGEDVLGLLVGGIASFGRRLPDASSTTAALGIDVEKSTDHCRNKEFPISRRERERLVVAWKICTRQDGSRILLCLSNYIEDRKRGKRKN